MKRKYGQVWVETVIYTLIGLAIIGILLAASKPKIDRMKDKAVIEQSINLLNDISSQVYDVQIAPGNKRFLDVKITKGKFYINSSSNRVGLIIDSSYMYSELNKEIEIGNLKIITRGNDSYSVEIFMSYSVNITNKGDKGYVSYDSSPIPYKLAIENKGKSGGNLNVDLSVS